MKARRHSLPYQRATPAWQRSQLSNRLPHLRTSPALFQSVACPGTSPLLLLCYVMMPTECRSSSAPRKPGERAITPADDYTCAGAVNSARPLALVANAIG